MSLLKIDILDESENFEEFGENCGQIFINAQKLFFSCSFCDANFHDISKFLDHIIIEHSYRELEDNNTETELEDLEVDPKIERLPETVEDTEFLEVDDAKEEFEDEAHFAVTLDFSSKFGEFVKTEFDDAHVLSDTEAFEASECESSFDAPEEENSPQIEPVSQTKIEKATPKNVKLNGACIICHKHYKNLPMHELCHSHPTVKCKICGKIFQSIYNLKSHMTTHNPKRDHKCHLCGLEFTQKYNLFSHLRRHAGKKPYKCDICSKSFATSTEMKSHRRSHTGEKPFICEQCGRSFRTSSALSEHTKRHTKQKNYPCELCGKRFYDTHLLRDHMVTHTREKLFPCNKCSSSFSRMKTLRQHMKLHSGVKEYVCEICNKEFAQRPGLASHMKVHGMQDAKN